MKRMQVHAETRNVFCHAFISSGTPCDFAPRLTRLVDA